MRRKVLLLLSLILTSASAIFAQELRGKITDKTTKAPISGVTVSVSGTQLKSVTDSGGAFHFSSITGFPVELRISHVAYTGISRKVSDNSFVDIEMEPQASSMTDIVVVGYGTVRKRDLTGSVVSVKGNEVRKVAAGNAMESLQGKLPGVDIVRTSGTAGARSNITVRGNRSVLADNGPLYSRWNSV